MVDYEKLDVYDFCCEDCLLEDMLCKLNESKDEYASVSLFAKADMIQYMLRELMAKGFEIGLVDFDGCGYDYNNTYILTTCKDNKIWIEPAYIDGKPISGESEYAYIYQEDCDQDIIDRALESNESVILFGFLDSEDEEEDEPKEEEELLQPLMDESGKVMRGFEYMYNSPDGMNTYYRFGSSDEKAVKEAFKAFKEN